MATGSSKNRTKVVAYDDYIDAQLKKVRTNLKLTDISGRVMGLTALVVFFLLTVVIVDHWVVDLGVWGRLGSLVALLGGIAFYFVRFLMPEIARKINPAYAAQLVEREEPSLKTSLINFVMLRPKKEKIRKVVFDEVEQQAARRLSEVNVDLSVDQTPLIRIALCLLAALTLFALYTIFSPKSSFQTIGRVLSPFSNVARPARVQIKDVEPGDVQVFAGDRVDVSATIEYAADQGQAFLVYSTADGQVVNQQIEMTTDKIGLGFRATLPEGIAGIEQDMTYEIHAGDAVAGPWRVRVSQAPSIFIEEVSLDYPDYTGIETKVVESQGDIEGVEGTKVTITAQANQEIRHARIEFDPATAASAQDGRPDAGRRLTMKHDGSVATVTFPLLLNEDRRTPKHTSYQLRFTSTNGQTNERPIVYPISVTPDLPPLVEVLLPESQRIKVPENAKQRIEIRAVDPDFGISELKFQAKRESKAIVDESILDEPGLGQKVGRYEFSPQKLGLKAGDIVLYRGEAKDNRTDPVNGTAAPNVERTDWYAIVVSPPMEDGEEPEQEGMSRDDPEDGGGNEGDNGEEGQDGEGESPDGENGNEGEGNEGEGDQGEGGEGGEGAGQQEGEGADGQEGGSQNQNGGETGESSDGEAGAEGESGDGNDGEQMGDQPGEGERNSEGQDGDGGSNSEQTSGESDGDSKGAQAGDSQGENSNDAEGANGESDGKMGEGEPADSDQSNGGDSKGDPGDSDSSSSGQSGEQTEDAGDGEPIAGDGTEDSEAFDRILDEMKKENGEQSDGTPKPADGTEEAEGESGQGESGDPGEGEKPEGESGASGESGEDDSQEGEKGSGEGGQSSEGEQGDSGDSGESGTGEQSGDESGEGEQGEQGETGEGQSGESTDGEGQEGDGQSGDGEQGESGQSGSESTEGESGQGEKGDGESGQGKPGESSESGDAQSEGEQGQPGEQGSQSGQAEGESAEGQSQGEAGQGEKGQPGEQAGQPGEQGGDPSDPNQGTAGGTGGGEETEQEAVAEKEDKANLEYTRKATNLALDHLRDKENRRKMQEKLGWTTEQMNQFIRRWHSLRRNAAKNDGANAKASESELNQALRSLGLTPGRDRIRKSGSRIDKNNRVRDAGTRSRPPKEYEEQYKAYLRSVGNASGE